MNLHLCLLFLVFGDTSATIPANIVQICFKESDGTFDTNKDITFDYQNFLGEGKSGNVSLVECSKGDKYALKLAKSGEKLQLENEWEASKLITHNAGGRARVIKLFAIGSASGLRVSGDVVLMEYVEYDNLAELGFDLYSTTFTIETILDVAQGLVDCFEILSKGGVYHMDVKPENILYDYKTKKLVLIDLGLAYFKDSKIWAEDNKFLYGTVDYMCPCLRSQRLNAKCDIRSMLFILALPMFKGKLPWSDLCDHLKMTNSLFKSICDEKEYFERNLKATQFGTALTLSDILVAVRDTILCSTMATVDYAALRTALTMDNLESGKTAKEVIIEEKEEKGEKEEIGKSGEIGKREEIGKSEEIGKEEEKGKNEEQGESKKKVESDFPVDPTKEDGKEKKPFKRFLSGIKSKVSHFVKSVRGKWRKSKLVVNNVPKEAKISTNNKQC